MLILYTLLLFPFALHPAMGFIVKALSGGDKRRGFLIALLAGLFYDIGTNHLPFGVLTLFWIFSTFMVELFRKSFFLDSLKELILGTLLFAFTLEALQALFLGYPQASLSLHPFYEAITALVLIWAFPYLRKVCLLKFRSRASA